MSRFSRSATFRAAHRCRGQSVTTVVLSNGQRVDMQGRLSPKSAVTEAMRRLAGVR